MAERTRFVLEADSGVAANNFDITEAPITPNGETWQINRIIFADKNIGDNLSGGFLVDWGSGGTREILAQAYLTGNTLDLPTTVEILGDGAKRVRIIRENNSAANKKMVCMVVAIKKL